MRRPSRLRIGVIAAWLGVVALSLDALVPIHLAFDLAEALATTTQRAEAADHRLRWRDPSRQLLALLTGHRDGDGHPGDNSDRHGEHHRRECAVCGSLATLAGFAPAASAPLSAPLRIAAPILVAAAESAPRAAPAVAYRSRAPPIASADPTT
ncbi:MAG: DUF2946 family protein [Stellaceae bacterium]